MFVGRGVRKGLLAQWSTARVALFPATTSPRLARRPHMQSSRTIPVSSVISTTASTAIQAVLAMLLGGFIIGMVGFSHIDILHNAAHDTRHSNAFPCH
jgi:cobalt transporter subunit CbtB